MKNAMKVMKVAKAKSNTKKRPAANKDGDADIDPAIEVASNALSATGSTKEKMAILRDLGDDMEVKDKIALMNKQLTHEDWQKLIGYKKTAEKGDPSLKAKPEATNGEKRQSLMGWVLDPSKGTVYEALKHNMVGAQTMEKKDEWVSWRKVLENWTEEEALMHLDSGRIVSRECQDTAGVWEYKDTNNVVRTRTITRNKSYEKTGGQKMLDAETMEDDEQCWGRTWNKMGSLGGLEDAEIFGGGGESKGKGRGKGKLKGAGGKPKGEPLALEDDPSKKLTACKTQLKIVTNKAMTMCYDNQKMRNKLKPLITKLQKLSKQSDSMTDESTDKVKAFCQDVQNAVKAAKAHLD